MTADALGGDEGAHAEAVDEVVVEGLVLEGLGGEDVAGRAGLVGLWGDEVEGVLAVRGGGRAGVC